MSGHIKIDKYNGELGNCQKKLLTIGVSQWNAFRRRERLGTNQMFFVKELSTVVGREAQEMWRQFVERDKVLPDDHPGEEEQAAEIATRKIWKR